MRIGKNFYIYLLKKISTIRSSIPDKQTPSGYTWWTRVYTILKKIGIAAVTTVFVYNTVVFLNVGRLVWPDAFMLYEMGFAFLYLLGLFWAHRNLSSFLSSVKVLAPILKLVVEVILVILVSLIISFVLNLMPLRLLFPEVYFAPDRIRTAFVISTIISLFFYYFVERERHKKLLQKEMLRSASLQKENFEAQLQFLKNQVNPHFLFNSLNVLSSLIRIDQDRAVEFVRKLSEVYRSFLDNSEKEVITLREEMEVVEAYIFLLKTRFGEAVAFRVDISSESYDLSLPPGAVQSLVENAVKHNGSTPKDPLQVKIYLDGENLVVTNNLRPRKTELPSTKTGLQNLSNRYKYLTDAELEFSKGEKEFMAKIPLLNLNR